MASRNEQGKITSAFPYYCSRYKPILQTEPAYALDLPGYPRSAELLPSPMLGKKRGLHCPPRTLRESTSGARRRGWTPFRGPSTFKKVGRTGGAGPASRVGSEDENEDEFG
jgi:hypothetical protein